MLGVVNLIICAPELRPRCVERSAFSGEQFPRGFRAQQFKVIFQELAFILKPSIGDVHRFGSKKP